MKEQDVAAFTICAVDDPRTLNKVLYLRPPGNVYSMNELVEVWESKIGKKLDKTYASEDELLMKIKGVFVAFIVYGHLEQLLIPWLRHLINTKAT